MDNLTTLQNKVISPKNLKNMAEQFAPLRGQYPMVTTNGCFDLLHFGHLKLLTFCASLSPYVVVLLNSDASVRQLKGPSRPIQDEQSRSLLLAGFSFVWRVCLFREQTPIETLKILRPNIHVKSSEYQSQQIPEEQLMRELGGEMKYFPLEPNFSTTQLIQKIKQL